MADADEHPEGGPPTSEAAEATGGASTFAYLALEGERFDALGMPTDAVKEIATYRDLVLELAVEAWKRDNPDRVKAPNGFRDAFDLRLTKIGEGSARPELYLHKPSRPPAHYDEWVGYYARARDEATDAIRRAGQAQAMPNDVPASAAAVLRRIGSTLEANDKLFVGAPDNRSEEQKAGLPAPMRSEVTAKLHKALRVYEIPPQLRDVEQVGVLTEWDGELKSFWLRTDAGRVECLLESMNTSLADLARTLLAMDGVTGPDVRVFGQTLDDDHKRVRRLHNVHRLEVVWSVVEKRIVHQVRQLAALEPGWLGHGSLAPTAAVAQRVEPHIRSLTALARDIGVSANPDGGISVVWRRGSDEYTLVFDLDGAVFLCIDNVETDELRELTSPYDPDLVEAFITEGLLP